MKINQQAAAIREKQLTMRRKKPSSLAISAAYRFKRVLQWALGSDRFLQYCLNADWLLRRFAHETASEKLCVATNGDVKADPFLVQFLRPEMTVVDIGCGVGYWSRLLAPYVSSIVGIDYSPEKVEMARSLTKGANVEYRVADVIHTDIGGPYDVALLMHVLEHIDNVDDLLRSLRHKTKALVVGVPDFEADHLNETRLTLGCPFYSDADHVREYTQEMLQWHLERSGWSVQSVGSKHGTATAFAI